MVKAIVFDIGGVLIDLDPARCIEAFQTILGFGRITEILDPSHQKGIYGDMEAGILPAGEILFIDDNQANVDGALSVGMQARYYLPGSPLSALLADL